MTECLGTETLVEFVEGRADASIRARVESHASHCEDCRAVLSSLARGSTTGKIMPVGTPTRPSDPALALAADMTVGRYIIQRALGAGGMGVVYAARDPELDRVVAVKVLRGDGGPSMQQRLRREAKAMAQVAHPNVVAVYDVGAIGERIFIAMEYIEGETLAKWLKTRRTPRAILEAYRDAGRGLAVAHAAGIVHRDFKPENVLVGNDGRVRVVDFGLARTAGTTENSLFRTGGHTPISPDAPTELANLTQTGAMVGTPYYMAPELYDGAAGDARSDQFSLCVALFTALYARRPFDGDTLETLAENTRAGRIHEPRSGVPRRIRAAIRRGLSVDPAARFASIDELLVAIEPPSRLRVLIPIATLAVIGTGAFMVKASISADAPDQRCTGAAAAFAGAWNPARRAAIDKAFGASHLSYAATALHEVDTTLDHYADSWIAAHTEACRATRVRGEQTDAMLDRRMLCLARRKQEASAFVDALSSADDAVIARSLMVVGTLPDVASCADTAALSQIVAPPSDPAMRAKIEALTLQLAQARARFQTGKLPAGLELATKVANDARTIAYRPFEAEADLLQAELEHAMGRDTAKASFDRAVIAAEAGRHDEIAARGWTDLVFLVGYEGADYAKGAELAQHASAAITRLGGNPGIESNLEKALGAIAADQGKLDDAVAHFEKALALDDKTFGSDHPNVAAALDNLGMAVMAHGDPDRAIALQQRGLAIRERRLGKDHPSVAQSLHNLGNAHAAKGNYALAETEEKRALAIRRTTLPPDHPDIAANLSDLARAVRMQGRDDEALALDREAVAIGEKAFGPTNPSFALQLSNLGVTLSQLRHYDEAEATLARAEAILAKLDGPGAATMHTARGDNLLRQKRWRDAIGFYEHALPILITTPGDGDSLISTRVNLARAQLAIHQPKLALAAIDPAMTVPRDHMAPNRAASIDFIYACVLWDSGGDRKRAHELATAARAIAAPDDVSEIDAWLAKH